MSYIPYSRLNSCLFCPEHIEEKDFRREHGLVELSERMGKVLPVVGGGQLQTVTEKMIVMETKPRLFTLKLEAGHTQKYNCIGGKNV